MAYLTEDGKKRIFGEWEMNKRGFSVFPLIFLLLDIGSTIFGLSLPNSPFIETNVLYLVERTIVLLIIALGVIRFNSTYVTIVVTAVYSIFLCAGIHNILLIIDYSLTKSIKI